MTKPKTKYPIESFGPELMAALTKGGREKVEIKFPSKSMGHRFQMRLNMLRARMRELDHPAWKIASRARVSLMWGNRANEPDWKDDDLGMKGSKIVITPKDSEFGEALKNAGVKVEELGNDPLDESNIPEEDKPKPFTDPLDELDKKET